MPCGDSFTVRKTTVLLSGMLHSLTSQFRCKVDFCWSSAATTAACWLTFRFPKVYTVKVNTVQKQNANNNNRIRFTKITTENQLHQTNRWFTVTAASPITVYSWQTRAPSLFTGRQFRRDIVTAASPITVYSWQTTAPSLFTGRRDTHQHTENTRRMQTLTSGLTSEHHLKFILQHSVQLWMT